MRTLDEISARPAAQRRPVTHPLRVVMTAGMVLRRHTFELVVGLAWILVGTAYLFTDNTIQLSPVGRNVGVWVQIWSTFYVCGGVFVIFGLFKHLIQFRVAGLLLLAAGTLMHGIAAATFQWEPRVFVYFVYSAGCTLRAVVCWRQSEKRW